MKDNFDFSKYDEIQIIITHLHNDHAGSLSQFILYLWFIYHKKATIFSNCHRIKDYLEITGANPNFYELKDSNDNIQFIETTHVAELDAYGFKLNVNNKSIVYTGDTITLSPYLPYLKNCDEFYVDVSRYGGVHLKFEDIIPNLEEIKNTGTKVFLMHIDDREYIRELNNDKFFME